MKRNNGIGRILRKRNLTGADLFDLRYAFGWTQEEMSKILEIDQSQVSRWEREIAPVPKWAVKLLRLHCREKEIS